MNLTTNVADTDLANGPYVLENNLNVTLGFVFSVKTDMSVIKNIIIYF